MKIIKKFRIPLIFFLLYSSQSATFSLKYEREMYIGCYSNSKKYIGTKKLKSIVYV